MIIVADNLKKSEMDVLKKTDKETPKTKLKNDTEEVSNLSKTSPVNKYNLLVK